MVTRRDSAGKVTFRKDYADHCIDCAEACIHASEDGSCPDYHVIFNIARDVKWFNPSIDINPLEVAQMIYNRTQLVREWMGEEDFLERFQSSWEKVKILPGEDLIGSSVRMADATPLIMPDHIANKVTAGFKRFISVCGWMCVSLGTNRIKIPCREMASALGVDKETVVSYRQRAIKHDLLKLLKAHKYNPNGRGEATLFAFRVDMWPCLRDRMPKPEGES